MAKTDHHLSDLERAQIQAHLELGFKVLLLGAECASNLKVCGIRTHLKSTTAWSTSPCALLRGIRHSLRKRLRKTPYLHTPYSVIEQPDSSTPRSSAMACRRS